MNAISISQLKVNPSQFILQANEYPVPIEKRNKVTAYLIGSALFEKIVAYLEDTEDREAIKTTNYKKGQKFEDLAAELNI